MLTHHALEMLKRRTGLTKARWVKLIEPWYKARHRRERRGRGGGGHRQSRPPALRGAAEASRKNQDRLRMQGRLRDGPIW